jgi:hypothetical protein
MLIATCSLLDAIYSGRADSAAWRFDTSRKAPYASIGPVMTV